MLQRVKGNVACGLIRNRWNFAAMFTELFPLIRSLLSQLPDKSGVMGELCRIIRDLGSGIVWVLNGKRQWAAAGLQTHIATTGSVSLCG